MWQTIRTLPHSHRSILTPHMLPKHKAATRLQQLPHLLHHTLHVTHRAQHLDTQYSIQTPLCNPLLSQDLAVFDTTRYEFVLILETTLLGLCGNVVCIVRVGVNGVYEVHEGCIVALDLVAWSRAEFEDFPFRRADKGGDTGGIFKGDKAAGCARESV
jgi:hypothetical protein